VTSISNRSQKKIKSDTKHAHLSIIKSYKQLNSEINWFSKIYHTKGAKTASFILSFFAIMLLLSNQKSETTKTYQSNLSAATNVELGALPIIIPNVKYGFAVDTFEHVKTAEIQEGQFFGEILSDAGVSYPNIEKIVQNADTIFDVKQFRVGKEYMLLSKDTSQGYEHFIYQPSVYNYTIFDLKGDLTVTKVERPITTVVEASKGAIESSLWNAMTDAGLSYNITAKMEDALQWSVDFHHVQQGDEFKLIYDQDYIEGERVDAGKVHAAWYQTSGNEYYAFYFEHPEHGGYYDAKGRPMNKGFLKSPVKYSRISSGFNLRRFHPILKRTKPHFGTDYAAPYGTPILAVGDGVVTKASRTRGNGNFVKIRHDKTYETQYLHMQKFAKGISPGVHVKQGQVIGYIGSTGLATGPHVCFRFWKNGKQVNHRKLSFPPPAPLPDEFMPQFTEQRDILVEKLNAL
jgi:murein DD-endopeptidase MepM/ murein hydrolase activator NlpD